MFALVALTKVVVVTKKGIGKSEYRNEGFYE